MLACAAMLVSVPASASAAGNRGNAHAARTLNGTDTARLHLVHQHETVVFEEGVAAGGMPGRMKVQLNIGVIFAGNCTVYAPGGSITGHGTAIPHGSGRYQSFHGSLLITGGTDRYAHIHGRAGLFGTFDRRTFALVLQTTGKLSY
jgi:hypothetical protein